MRRNRMDQGFAYPMKAGPDFFEKIYDSWYSVNISFHENFLRH